MVNAPNVERSERKGKDYLRGFSALIAAQFQGVFTNNLFTLLIVFYLARFVYADGDGETADLVAPMSAILCSLPFIIFPGLLGALSDRFSKRSITVLTKYVELILVAVGFVAFKTGEPYFLWTMVLLMAVKSAIFSPSKYGILPEIVPNQQLSWANGMLQICTIFPILLATLIAGPLREYLDQDVHWAMLLLFAGSIFGLIAAHRVTRVPAANPSQRITFNPWHGLGGHLAFLCSTRRIFVSIVGYVFFWFVSYLVMVTVFRLGLVTLEMTDSRISVVIASMAFGAGLGSLASGYLSREKIEMGLVPPGLFGTAIFALVLAIPNLPFLAICVVVFLFGWCGGLFSVPLVATLQQQSPEEMKGGVMATVNMLTFFGIGSAAALFLGLRALEVSTYELFLFTGLATIVFGVVVCVLQPVYLLRTALWILTSTLYRVHSLGHDNLPHRTGALIVANHASFLDALVLLVSTDRHIRFIMAKPYYDVFWIKPFAKLMGAIPIMRGGGPRSVVQSLRGASDAIKNGEIVCIFAEGQITRTGQLLPFRSGYQKIMQDVDAPIIPVHLDKLWGSIFSYSKGRFFWKLPRRIPFDMTVTYGEPLPSNTPPTVLRAKIQELGVRAYGHRNLWEPILHRAFIKTARRNLRRRAIADERTGALSYFRTLTGSIVLARKLKERLGPEEMIGVLLPPSIGCALTNIALQMLGRAPVNLNYTSSGPALASAARRCDMKQVITARTFLEKVTIDVPGEPIYVDDILKTVTGRDRAIATAYALLSPIKFLERRLGGRSDRSPDDLATVIFSSGSEDEPKGVMLTHYNISSNIDCILQVFPHKRGDVLVGILPIFHSFGFTATLWLPLTSGLNVVFHPNPLEPRKIGKLIAKYSGQIMFTTSTFLQGFIRRCSPLDLSSLEFIICGAEKLAPRVRDAFKDKFGVEPLEGYGTTECSPVVSLNLPDYRAPGFYQKGTKRGSIGLPLPGICVKAVNPETGAPVEEGQPGMLCIKGPNVMQGYLGLPEKTAEVLKDGWYETGDIVTLDEEGFITITDRLARFSKIGGEMVSHTQVEEALHNLIDTTERMVAVTGVPDQSKGERLVVLHTLDNGEFDDLVAKLDELELPKICIPKSGAFYNVDEIPVLGTGKMDLKAVKTMAQKFYIGE